ncbi:MAG: response regulator [Chloroflexota bacterium]|nr:response regulator [Chloroflexota bacterium]
MFNRANAGGGNRGLIRVVIVDDITDTLENIKKLLAFEDQEFQVVGTAGNGRQAIDVVVDTQPDIVLMDINMPDMDGIEATRRISKAVPSAAVIIMSVQADTDYFKRAMLAGARSYLTKPVQLDELYNTIRAVYEQHESVRAREAAVKNVPIDMGRPALTEDSPRPGHVVAVYSPQGGAGCTTIATNLATGLMKKNIKVLLIDADIQFGDVGIFLKLQSASTLHDLVDKIDDLDTEFFDSIVATHESGLKVLLGPPKLELALEVEQTPNAVARIVEKVARHYDFVVVDCGTYLNEAQLALFDVATKIVLVANPTLPAIKNSRFMLDLFDRLNYMPDKTIFVLNQIEDERAQRQGRVTIPTETIEKHLKRKVEASIPTDQRSILSAVNKGVPAITLQRDRSKSPTKELVELADHLFSVLMNDSPEQVEEAPRNGQAKKPLIRLGGR